MPHVEANGLSVYYESHGADDDETDREGDDGTYECERGAERTPVGDHRGCDERNGKRQVCTDDVALETTVRRPWLLCPGLAAQRPRPRPGRCSTRLGDPLLPPLRFRWPASVRSSHRRQVSLARRPRRHRDSLSPDVTAQCIGEDVHGIDAIYFNRVVAGARPLGS